MIISLLAFHRFLIVAAIAFCLGYAGWEMRAWLQNDDGGALAIAVLFLLLGVGLALYLRRLGRFLGYDRAAGPPR